MTPKIKGLFEFKQQATQGCLVKMIHSNGILIMQFDSFAKRGMIAVIPGSVLHCDNETGVLHICEDSELGGGDVDSFNFIPDSFLEIVMVTDAAEKQAYKVYNLV